MWYGLNYYWCLKYFPDPEPLHSVKPDGNGCMSIFGEIWTTCMDMWKTNPEAGTLSVVRRPSSVVRCERAIGTIANR